jgi:hypothetical protein
VQYVIWITAPLNVSIVTISSHGVAGGYWPVPPSAVKFEDRSGLFSKTHNFAEINVLLFERLEQPRGTTNIVTMTRHTMMEHTHMSAASRDRFIRAAENEMAKFERREMEFRKKDREERAAELQIPLSKDDHH